MSIATKTYEVYKQFGVLNDVKHIGILFNRDKSRWECTALYHNENGYKNARIAEFDDVNDAVIFKNLVMFS